MYKQSVFDLRQLRTLHHGIDQVNITTVGIVVTYVITKRTLLRATSRISPPWWPFLGRRGPTRVMRGKGYVYLNTAVPPIILVFLDGNQNGGSPSVFPKVRKFFLTAVLSRALI